MARSSWCRLSLVLLSACGVRVNGDGAGAIGPSNDASSVGDDASSGVMDVQSACGGNVDGGRVPMDASSQPPSDAGVGLDVFPARIDAHPALDGDSTTTPDACGSAADASGTQPVTILQTPDGVYAYAIAGADIYWSTFQGSVLTSRAFQCPTSVVTLATGQLYADPLLVNATDVYWPTFTDMSDAGASSDAGTSGDASPPPPPPTGTIATCARTGCGGTPMLLESTWLPVGLGLDDASVYTMQASSGAIVRCPLIGCGAVPTSLTQGPALGTGISTYPARLMAVDRGDIFFPTGMSLFPLASCSTSNCAATLHDVTYNLWPLAGGGGGGLYVLGFDASNVYWYDGAGNSANPSFGPMACARLGCVNGPTQLAIDSVGYTKGNITPTGEVVADATSVYWLTVPAFYPWEQPLANSTLSRCSRANCSATVTRIVTGLVAPYGLAQDDAHLYWAEGTGAPPLTYGQTPATIKQLAK